MKTSESLKRGFTLVEIMIVVAIIGLLAAVAIPNLIKARNNAQDTVCISQLDTIKGVMETWGVTEQKQDSDEVSLEDLDDEFNDGKPHCPAGGEYILGKLEDKPRCTVHGLRSDFHSEEDKKDGDRLPKGSTLYVAVEGETLKEIALNNGVSEQSIRDANSKKKMDWDDLAEGRRVASPDNQWYSGPLPWLLIGGLILAIYWINFKKPKRKNNHFASGSVDRSASSSTPLFLPAII